MAANFTANEGDGEAFQVSLPVPDKPRLKTSLIESLFIKAAAPSGGGDGGTLERLKEVTPPHGRHQGTPRQRHLQWEEENAL